MNRKFSFGYALRVFTAVTLVAACMFAAVSCAVAESGSGARSRYANDALWAFKETDKDAKVDTFFLAPIAAKSDNNNISLDDPETLEKIGLQIGNQKGIYDGHTRFFAPYYSQAMIQCFMRMSPDESKPYFDIAYRDVKEAFEYYLEHWNGGRPIVLAGHSEGSMLLIRLLKEFFNTPEMANKLVCCYAIGWKVTEDDMKELKYVHFATGPDDVNSIVSFNTEAPDVKKSIVVGENEKALCINPLDWSVSCEPVPKDKNLGCCIFSTKGYQKGPDIVGFTGAYIDPERGTLKVTDVQDPDGSLYPPRLEGQDYGVYHVYDWEFFYRNLQRNVDTRVEKYRARQDGRIFSHENMRVLQTPDARNNILRGGGATT